MDCFWISAFGIEHIMQATGKSRSRRILRQITGYGLLAGGLAGCVLPIIPGIPLLIGGLTLLSADTPWAARLLQKLKARVQRVTGRGPQKTSQTSH